MDLKFWKKALREAEREVDGGTTRTTLDAAAKKFMRAKAELKRLQAEVSPNPAECNGPGPDDLLRNRWRLQAAPAADRG